MAGETSRPAFIPNPAVRRLSYYLRQLESYQKKSRRTVSSKQFGVALGYTDAQVRKDLAYFGQFGHPGIGYKVDELSSHIRQIIGTDKTWGAILVGAGNLGRALLSYAGFESKGFRIVAVFDSDERKIGQVFGSHHIRPTSEIRAYVQEHRVRLAILAVPADVAQDVGDDLVNAGIQGILNFAPVALVVPPYVALSSVDVAIQLEQLAFHLNSARKEQR